MKSILLAGFKSTSTEDQQLYNYYKHRGYDVRTYNKQPGLASSTDIFQSASGVDHIVNMAKITPANTEFHKLCARVAGERGATFIKTI